MGRNVYNTGPDDFRAIKEPLDLKDEIGQMEEFKFFDYKGEEGTVRFKKNPHFSKPEYDSAKLYVGHEDEGVPCTEKAWDATRPKLLSPDELRFNRPYPYYEKARKEDVFQHFERDHDLPERHAELQAWIKFQTIINNHKQMHNNTGFISTQLKTVQSIEDYEKLLKWMIKNVPLPDRVQAEDNKLGILASVLEFGLENGIGWAEALGQLIPTGDGRFMIKGDLAKAKIFGSGYIVKWDESVTGSIEEGTYAHTITGARTLTDNPIANTEVAFERSYSIAEAIKAGLYNPELKGKDSEFWRNYPERMCMYRALGHLARDYFGDVLRNMVLTEEYLDYKKTDGNTIVRQGHKLDMSKSTKQEKENGDVSQAIVDKANGSKEEPNDPKGIEVKDPVWMYNAETDNLSIHDRADVDESLFYILGSAVECTKEEGDELLANYNKAPTETDWVELAKECETGVDLVKHIEEHAPTALVEWVNLIDGRKTKNRLYELIDVFTEDENQVEAYFLKTYPKVNLEGLSASPKVEEAKHEKGGSAELPEEKVEPKKEELPATAGNVLGIEWGEGSPESPRHFKIISKSIRQMSAHDGKLYGAFEDIFMEQNPESKDDAEDALSTYPAGQLDDILNQAVKSLK